MRIFRKKHPLKTVRIGVRGDAWGSGSVPAAHYPKAGNRSWFARPRHGWPGPLAYASQSPGQSTPRLQLHSTGRCNFRSRGDWVPSPRPTTRRLVTALHGSPAAGPWRELESSSADPAPGPLAVSRTGPCERLQYCGPGGLPPPSHLYFPGVPPHKGGRPGNPDWQPTSKAAGACYY